jgi:phosphonate transport system ATP-binding protein
MQTNGDDRRPANLACQLDSVSVRYRQFTALTDVSLRIAEGETVAIVGPSGAGKTSLLRLLSGMLRQVSGSVFMFGRPLAAMDHRRELPLLVGMMQQRFDLVPQLSVRNNVEAGMLGQWNLLRTVAGLFLSVRHPGAAEAIRRVGLEGRGNDRVSKLSGGEQQRVALARVLTQAPRIILADEPVASLDPELADDLLSLLRQIADEQGRTVIASLHVPEMARRHFDRVIGLRHGTITFDVPASELREEQLRDLYSRAPVAREVHAGRRERQRALDT